MTQTMTALYSFMSSFGLPAYVEGYVPDGATLPYITYSVADPDWQSMASINMKLWYRSTSYSAMSAKIDAIDAKIGEGLTMPTSNGMIMISKDSNFVQFITDEDPTIKVAYISLILHSFN